MKYRYLLNTRIFRIFQSFQLGQPVQWVATDFAWKWPPRLQKMSKNVDTIT